jgi:hypothetical protein
MKASRGRGGARGCGLEDAVRSAQMPGLVECVEGLLDAHDGITAKAHVRPGALDAGTRSTFSDWIIQNFGAGLARAFLLPYNSKVWATDPSDMSSH